MQERMREREREREICDLFAILYYFIDTVVSQCMRYVFITSVSFEM